MFEAFSMSLVMGSKDMVCQSYTAEKCSGQPHFSRILLIINNRMVPPDREGTSGIFVDINLGHMGYSTAHSDRK